MKKITLIFAIFSFITIYGQSDKSKGQQIKALKIAFITNELELTPKEASQFWPVYNAFDEKQKHFRKQKNASLNMQNKIQIDKLSDKDALIILAQIESEEEQLYLLKKKFVKDLMEVLAPIKILQLKKAEEDFNRKLLKQYRSKR